MLEMVCDDGRARRKEAKDGERQDGVDKKSC